MTSEVGGRRDAIEVGSYIWKTGESKLRKPGFPPSLFNPLAFASLTWHLHASNTNHLENMTGTGVARPEQLAAKGAARVSTASSETTVRL